MGGWSNPEYIKFLQGRLEQAEDEKVKKELEFLLAHAMNGFKTDKEMFKDTFGLLTDQESEPKE